MAIKKKTAPKRSRLPPLPVIVKPKAVFPEKITVVSDDNELQLQSSATDTATYVYTKSIAKMGMTVPVTDEQLKKNVSNGIWKI